MSQQTFRTQLPDWQSLGSVQLPPSGTGVLVGVEVGVFVGVAVGVSVGVSVGVGVFVGVFVGVGVFVAHELFKHTSPAKNMEP
ncbi:MAG: hypothetical protein AB7V27_07625 [Candidatus Binatia bacterium]